MKIRTPLNQVMTRLETILQVAQKFKEMDASKSQHIGRVMCLTQDSGNALHVTLNEILCLIKLLLNRDFGYVLLGNFKMIDWKENSELTVSLKEDVIIYQQNK